MARKYAAVMALLAITVVLLRGLKDGAGCDATLTTGLIWMAVFAAMGMLLGTIAETTIVQSVQSRLEAELAAIEKPTEEEAQA